MKRGPILAYWIQVPVLVQKLHQFDLGKMPYRYLSNHVGKRERMNILLYESVAKMNCDPLQLGLLENT